MANYQIPIRGRRLLTDYGTVFLEEKKMKAYQRGSLLCFILSNTALLKATHDGDTKVVWIALVCMIVWSVVFLYGDDKDSEE